jgi:hypothetical protein
MSVEANSASLPARERLTCTCAQAHSSSAGGRTARSGTVTKGPDPSGTWVASAHSPAARTTRAIHGRSRRPEASGPAGV